MTLQPFVQAIIAGALFSIRGYVKKNPYGETFDWSKFVGTVVVGSVIAAAAILAGNPLSEAEYAVKIAAYGGIIAAVEGVVKYVARMVEQDENVPL